LGQAIFVMIFRRAAFVAMMTSPQSHHRHDVIIAAM
jgi:hypothetical protein